MDRKHRNKFILQIGISLVLLTFLLMQIHPSQLKKAFLVISPSEAVGIAVLLIPSLLVRGWRWKLLFENDSHHIGIFESIQLLFVGLSLNLFLPASSGDIVKSYYGYKWSGIKERMLSISLLDKFIALGSIGLLGLPFALYRHNMIYLGLSCLVLFGTCFLLVAGKLGPRHKVIYGFLESLSRWVREKINFLALLRHTQVSSNKLLGAVVLSLAGWVITYFQLYGCFHAVGAEVSLTFVLSVAPLLTLARLFPFALNGLGSDEMVLYYVFQTQELTLEQILIAALLFRLIVIVLAGLPGFWLLLTKRKFQSIVNLDQTDTCS